MIEEPSELNWTDYGTNPPRPDAFLCYKIYRLLPGNGGCLSLIISLIILIALVAAIGAISFLGFFWAERTVLPFEYISFKTISAILVVSAISPILIFPFVENKSKGVKDLFKGYWVAFGSLFLLLYLICGYVLFIFFGANKYIAGSEPQYTDGKVTDITCGSESGSYSMDVEVPEFNTHYSVPLIYTYTIGDICKVRYHKGLCGLYVIDEFN